MVFGNVSPSSLDRSVISSLSFTDSNTTSVLRAKVRICLTRTAPRCAAFAIVSIPSSNLFPSIFPRLISDV
ncbi:hypothetical protein D3C83_62420 [compost metagenome]